MTPNDSSSTTGQHFSPIGGIGGAVYGINTSELSGIFSLCLSLSFFYNQVDFCQHCIANSILGIVEMTFCLITWRKLNENSHR